MEMEVDYYWFLLKLCLVSFAGVLGELDTYLSILETPVVVEGVSKVNYPYHPDSETYYYPINNGVFSSFITREWVCIT